jgi:hypothetical protein
MGQLKQGERIMNRINWKEVFKFLSGVTFTGAIANFYLWLHDIPLPFLTYTISPRLLGARSVVHLVAFVLFFYFGYLSRPGGLSRT